MMQTQNIPTTITLKGDFETREVWIDGQRLDPAPSLKVWNHSPDGFNWGYGGSGPAQLALAILMKYMSKEEASRNHQSFKWEFVSKLPRESFVHVVSIRQIIEHITKAK